MSFVLERVRAHMLGDAPVYPADNGTCGGALEALIALDYYQTKELQFNLPCRIAADCIDSCAVQGLNDAEWNVELLESDDERNATLSQLLRAARRITRAVRARMWCAWDQYPNATDRDARLDVASSGLRDETRLVALGVPVLARLAAALAFEYTRNYTSDQRPDGWFKNMKRLEEMLNTLLMGWVYDVQSISEQIVNDKTEEGKKSDGHYLIRLQLSYFEQYLHFRDNFSERRDEQPPSATQMFGVANVLYFLFYNEWVAQVLRVIDVLGRALESAESYPVLSVDTDCLQLLATEDAPPEMARRCQQQLWVDVLQRSPRLPVTSYLAYTQRSNIDVCELADMAAFSQFCQAIPLSSVSEFVRYARCYLDGPDHMCLQSNTTDAICHASRVIVADCSYDFFILDLEPQEAGNRSRSLVVSTYLGIYSKDDELATERFLSYKESPQGDTLKFKDFKVENLQPLENSFIAVNIFFRVLSVGLYAYLPHLRNLPGKILLSFQTTGLVQVLFTEVLYRMAGVPDLSTTVLVDSTLTLLGCLWLNTFCYHMYACVRHLRLPNDLPPFEVNRIFRRLVLCALIPCIIVCATTTALEKTGTYYVLHSRIIFLIVISTSILLNMVFLILLLYMYLHTQKSMRQLNIHNEEKFASKMQILYLSVKTVILSGIGVIIRIGFHQAENIAQYVYYVHIVTMMQGPVFFIFFICNGTTLPVLKNRVLKLWNPNIIIPGQELCSSAEVNLSRKRNELPPTAESSL